jgi:acyl-CoA reductase-like NAD-dependent aldehyde dehydrogenase
MGDLLQRRPDLPRGLTRRRSFVPADPALPETKLGALVSDEHLEGVLARVAAAADGGTAQVLVGGQRAHPVPGGSYLYPTIIDAPDPSDAIVQEEVFGPVLTIQEADGLEAAVALANGTRYGLAAAVWSSNITTAHRVARRLRAGTVWVNTYDVSSLATPFGGFKDSGHGRDRSLHALEAYTQLKTTWISL